VSLIVDPSVVDNQTATLAAAVVEPQSKSPATKEAESFEVPEKFKGKSAEEIAKSYIELEREFGRVRNDVGEYRSLTDRLLAIEEKRVSDLEGAGGKAADSDFTIDPTELLTNPRETLEKWYEHRVKADPVYQKNQERLDRIEGQYDQKEITSAHPDAADITNSPEFHSWVQEHPVRLGIARTAVEKRDITSLDYLLTEYKSKKGTTTEPEPKKQDSEADLARRVVTEKASSGSPTSTRFTGTEVFSRRKLIDLKIRNPEEYSAMQDRILSAYAEGRVTD